MAVLVSTFVLVCAGVMAVKLGRVVSATALLPVMKLCFTAVSLLPLKSHTLFNTNSYPVDTDRLELGVKVMLRPLLASTTLPATGIVSPVFTKLTVALLTHITLSGSLNVSCTLALTGKLSLPDTKLPMLTTGAWVSASFPVVKYQYP